MSLNWSAAKVKNYEELEKDPEFAAKLKCVVFDTMNVGINPITEANYKEFRRRQLMLRQVQGYTYAELQAFAGQVSLEFVHQLVGLGTNASTKTVTQFNKDLIAYMEQRIHVFAKEGK